MSDADREAAHQMAKDWECDHDALSARIMALEDAVELAYSLLRRRPGETHQTHGNACGIDACSLCLAEANLKLVRGRCETR